MGGPNGWGQKINDPLLLEEEILNTLFEVRYYNLKIKDLRRTQGSERVFKKKQLANEQKAHQQVPLRAAKLICNVSICCDLHF